MVKSFRKAFWNIVPDMALIFASIYISGFLTIEKSALSFLGTILIIVIALFAKYIYSDKQ
jgi:hypothetical protein